MPSRRKNRQKRNLIPHSGRDLVKERSSAQRLRHLWIAVSLQSRIHQSGITCYGTSGRPLVTRRHSLQNLFDLGYYFFPAMIADQFLARGIANLVSEGIVSKKFDH